MENPSAGILFVNLNLLGNGNAIRDTFGFQLYVNGIYGSIDISFVYYRVRGMRELRDRLRCDGYFENNYEIP